MAILLTGCTGYIGSHVAAGLLERCDEPLNVLLRAKDPAEAEERLWRALQVHFDFPRFYKYLRSRITIFRGDLTGAQFGLPPAEYVELTASTTSIIHCAASLNRKSEKSCLNVNLRGTLEVVQLCRRAHRDHGIRRFSHVSTVAVAGHRQDEIVLEDQSIDWARSDYDPYARTKKFCEHMVAELLSDVSWTVFRPSVVLGHSRHGETTQFDMARAFAFLARLPVLPFRPDDRIDIVPVDFVADSIVTLHLKEKPLYERYHLSSGSQSQTFRQLTDSLAGVRKGRKPVYAPSLLGPFSGTIRALSKRRGAVGYGASLLQVFLPYLMWNTVFDNQRVVSETGVSPTPFSEYSYPLLKFSRDHRFTYPYEEWPKAVGSSAR